MTRDEHLAWCKQRALEYLPRDAKNAVASMLSDLGKHPGTREAAAGPVGLMGLHAAMGGRPDEVRRWVEGFN